MSDFLRRSRTPDEPSAVTHGTAESVAARNGSVGPPGGGPPQPEPEQDNESPAPGLRLAPIADNDIEAPIAQEDDGARDESRPTLSLVDPPAAGTAASNGDCEDEPKILRPEEVLALRPLEGEPTRLGMAPPAPDAGAVTKIEGVATPLEMLALMQQAEEIDSPGDQRAA